MGSGLGQENAVAPDALLLFIFVALATLVLLLLLLRCLLFRSLLRDLGSGGLLALSLGFWVVFKQVLDVNLRAVLAFNKGHRVVHHEIIVVIASHNVI